MSDEDRLGLWHVAWVPGTPSPSVLDQSNNLIATVANSSMEKMAARAGLIMAAPELYLTVVAALDALQTIAERESGAAGQIARDMIPVLEDTLQGANFLGEIGPEKLNGP